MNSNNPNTLIRKNATLAAAVLTLAMGTAFANTNTPTVQPAHHWPPPASNAKALQHSVTIAVSTHGRGVRAKPISPK